MVTQDTATTIQNIFDWFNNHDLERAAAAVTDDFELIDVATGQTFHGPEGFRQWLQGFLTAMPDAHAELSNLIVAGDWGFSEHTGRGTHTGPLIGPAGEIPPTGRSIEVQVAEVYQMRDGKLVRMRAYYDSATIMRQIGAIS